MPEPTGLSRWTPAGAALVAAVVLASVYWNLADLAVLRDHPLPGPVFWPAVWVLLAVAVTLLIPADRRSGGVTALTFGATGAVLAVAAVLGLVISVLAGRSGDLVDHVDSADGEFQIRVVHWQAALGEDGWDVVIQRQDGVDAYSGCLFAEESGDYVSARFVEAGSVRIVAGDHLITVAFEPGTMRITRPIPAGLCRGYG